MFDESNIDWKLEGTVVTDFKHNSAPIFPICARPTNIRSDSHPDLKSEINTNELFKYLRSPWKIVYFHWNKFLFGT